MELIHWTRTDSDEGGRKSLRWYPSDSLDRKRFRWKRPCSIRERLRKSSPMYVSEGLESRSDSIHLIHWRQTDSDGKVNVLLVRYLEKCHPCWMRGVGSRSDGIHWIHWRRTDSDGKLNDIGSSFSSFDVGLKKKLFYRILLQVQYACYIC